MNSYAFATFVTSRGLYLKKKIFFSRKNTFNSDKLCAKVRLRQVLLYFTSSPVCIINVCSEKMSLYTLLNTIIQIPR